MEKIPYGLIFFKPKNGKFVDGIPCEGFGSFSYKEGSVYTGDMYYDGARYNKIGFGKQDFSRVNQEYSIIKGKKQKLNLYIGAFDYRKTDWIYGNGVMYYVDENNNPSGFRIGFYKGLSRIKPYEGKFDYSSLLPGYRKEMEIKRIIKINTFDASFHKMNLELKNSDTKYDILFVGDSYLAYLKDEKYTGFALENKLKGISYINLAIGGTSCYYWRKYIPHINIKDSPKIIFLSLGFNDIHGGTFGLTLKKRYKDVIRKLQIKFPKSHIICFTVCHSPNYPLARKYEEEFNCYLLNLGKEWGVKVIDLALDIKNNGLNCFYSDDTHLSSKGYKIMMERIEEALEEFL